MASLTRQQVEKIVSSRPEGMSEQDAIKDIVNRGYTIQGLNDKAPTAPAAGNAINQIALDPGGTANSSTPVGSEKTTIAGDIGRAIIKPAVRVASGLSAGVEGAYAAVSPDFSIEDVRRRNIEGRDFGVLGRNVKPFGYQGSEIDERRAQGETITGGDIFKAGGRMTAGVAGGMAEFASYGIAPLNITGKGFFGFLNFLKGSAGVSSLASGAAMGESIEAGDSIGEIAATGAMTYAATTATFGLMRLAGRLFRNRGARLIQDDALRQSSEDLNNLMSDLVKTNPELLDPTFASNPPLMQTQILANKARPLEESFNKQMYQIRNRSIDRLLPNVDNPDIVTHNVYLGIANRQGSMFKSEVGSDAMYDFVRRQTSKLADEKLVNTNAAIAKAQQQLDDRVRQAAQDPQSMQRVVEESASLQNFLASLAQQKRNGLGIPDALRIMEDSYVYMDGAKADTAAIRSIIGSLRDDLRKGLPPEDVMIWDRAHNSWQRGTTLYEDPILNRIKDSGFGDEIVDGLMSSKPSPSRDLLFTTLNDPEVKPAVQDLLVNTALRRAKQMSNTEANTYLKKFKDSLYNYETGESYLRSDQAALVDDFVDFTSQTFKDTVYDMQNALEITPKEYRELVENFDQLDVFQELTSGKPDQVAKNFTAMIQNEPEKVGRVIGLFDDQEREVLGVFLMRDLMSRRNAAIVPDPNRSGRSIISDNFLKDYEDSYRILTEARLRTGSDDLYNMFSREELEVLERGYETLNDIRVLSTPEQNELARETVDAVTAMLYAKMGYITGAARYVDKAVRGPQVGKYASKAEIQETALKYLREGIERGEIPPDATMPARIDYLNARFAAPAVGANIGEGEDIQE